jgi:hypothetical protein
MAGDALAQGFMITPVGGFIRGPRGFVGFSPLGIVGRRQPMCAPVGGYGYSYSAGYSYGVPATVQLVPASSFSATSSAADAQSAMETIGLIKAIFELVRGSGGGGIIGGGGGAGGNVEARLAGLESRVLALESRIGSGSTTGGTPTPGGRPGQFGGAGALAAAADALAQAAASEPAGGAQFGPALSTQQLELYAENLLLQIQSRKLAVAAESRLITSEVEALQKLLETLKPRVDALK